MPFTLAHPAAVLPIWRASRRRVRLAPLVLGSMTPDFQYFIHLNTVGSFTHSLPGLVLVCLPAGWLSLWLFDRFGRRGVQALLPSAWRLPPPPTQQGSPAVVSAALFAGAATHVIWDSFTHPSGWVVQHWAVLSDPVVLGDVAFRWFKVAQYGSSVLGLGVLGAMSWRWIRTQPRISVTEGLRRVMLPTAVLGVAGTLNGLRFLSLGIQPFLVGGGVAVTLAVGAGLVLLGLARG